MRSFTIERGSITIECTSIGRWKQVVPNCRKAKEGEEEEESQKNLEGEKLGKTQVSV